MKNEHAHAKVEKNVGLMAGLIAVVVAFGGLVELDDDWDADQVRLEARQRPRADVWAVAELSRHRLDPFAARGAGSGRVAHHDGDQGGRDSSSPGDVGERRSPRRPSVLVAIRHSYPVRQSRPLRGARL